MLMEDIDRFDNDLSHNLWARESIGAGEDDLDRFPTPSLSSRVPEGDTSVGDPSFLLLPLLIISLEAEGDLEGE